MATAVVTPALARPRVVATTWTATVTAWESTYSVDSSAGTDCVWYPVTAAYTSDTTCSVVTWQESVSFEPPPVDPAIEAEFAEWARVRAQRARAAETARVLRDEADKRAEALLAAILSPAQARQYRARGYFEIVTPGGTYRLRKGWAGNVERLDAAGRPVEQLCIHPRERMPEADNLIAQKLLLEADEARFLRIANRTLLAAA